MSTKPQKQVRGKMVLFFEMKHADVAQRAADMLAAGPPVELTEGVLVLRCTVRRFERLMDEVAG